MTVLDVCTGQGGWSVLLSGLLQFCSLSSSDSALALVLCIAQWCLVIPRFLIIEACTPGVRLWAAPTAAQAAAMGFTNIALPPDLYLIFRGSLLQVLELTQLLSVRA